MKRFVENNFEFVDKDFSKRVRKFIMIKKIIKLYGTTTPKERKELWEGINILKPGGTQVKIINFLHYKLYN